MTRVIPLFVSLLLLAGAASGMSLPGHERVVLANGTVLLLSEKHDVPLIGLEAIVRGGAVTDPEGLNGLASLLAEVMQHGAGARDAAAFAEAVASVGGALSASTGLEALHVSAEFVSRDAELMIELVTDLLRRPRLDEDEFTKLRDRSINLIKAAKGANAGDLLPDYGNGFLFGQHVYGNPREGSEATLANVTYEDLTAYYDDFVGGDRLVVSVVGDFNITAMKERLSTAFGDWRAAAVPLPAVPPASPNIGRRVLLVDKPGATETYFWLGNIGVAVSYGRRADLNIANTVFGGRFTSMLMTELRTNAGLTYGAYARVRRPSQPGTVVIASSTATDTTVEAIDMALDILDRLHASGVDEDMLVSAKNYIMGQFPPRLETASQIAGQFAMLEQYGLDVAYVNGYGAALAATTTDSVADAIAEVYPSTDNLDFILVGDAAAIREAVSQYGAVTEMSIDEPRFRRQAP